MLQLFFVLRQLQVKSPAAADQVFLQAVAYLQSSPDFSPTVFLTLGNYLFGPAQSKGATGDSLTYTVIQGKVTIDVTSNHAEATEQLVTPYLEAALDLLNRPLPAGQPGDGDAMHTVDAGTCYAMAYQLLPKARQFAPNLVPAFEGVLANLAIGLPASFRDPESFKQLGTTIQQSDEDEPKELSSDTVDPAHKDDIRVSVISHLWTGNNTVRMRELASDISDTNLRGSVLALVQFREATGALDNNDPARAIEVAAAVPSGAKRSLLELGIAAGIKEQDRAYHTYALAIQDAAFAPVRNKPALLLAAANGLASVDQESAIAALVSAVEALNDADRYPLFKGGVARSWSTGSKPKQQLKDPDAPPAAPSGEVIEDWTELVDSPTMRHGFGLSVSAVKGLSMRETIATLVRLNPARVEAVLAELRAEDRQAEALTWVLEVQLADALNGPKH